MPAAGGHGWPAHSLGHVLDCAPLFSSSNKTCAATGCPSCQGHTAGADAWPDRAVAVLVVWYASGVGYCLSVLLAPPNALTASVAFIMLMGGFLNGVQPRYVSLSPFMKKAVGARAVH